MCEVEPLARVTGAFWWNGEPQAGSKPLHLGHIDPLVDELHRSLNLSLHCWLQQQFTCHPDNSFSLQNTHQPQCWLPVLTLSNDFGRFKHVFTRTRGNAHLCPKKKSKSHTKLHSGNLPLQVLCSRSQGSPVSWHLGPLVLGETSPRLVDANAATKGDCPTR